HDFACPWCWIGLSQVRRLRREFPGVEFNWLALEIEPEGMGRASSTPQPVETGRPPVPTRLDLAYAAEGIARPTAPRPRIISHDAHEAMEFAKRQGRADALAVAIYAAYYEQGADISDPGVLEALASGVLDDVPDMMRAIERRRFADRVVPFYESAYARGVYYVPTFFIAGEALAEQPYVVLREHLGKVLEPAA
ncbi:MAG: DsbA family protein, partial [Fimbriimonas ginsengisoli]|nr:DsbA family protein [Fimbriimonas ginsengisoli]